MFDIKNDKYIYASPSSYDLLGIKKDVFIKKKFDVITPKIHKDDREKARQHYKSVFTQKGRRKKSFYAEYRFKHGKNSYKWLADNHTIVYDNKGNAKSIIGNISDITRQKNTESELIKSNGIKKKYLDRLTSVQDALKANIVLLDKNGNIEAVNESWKKFANANYLLNRNYCVGINYLDVCRKAEGEGSKRALEAGAGIKKVLQGKLEEFSIEYPCHTQFERRWFRLITTPISRTRKEGALVMHFNITESKLTEMALKESEAHYKQLFEEDLTGNFVCDIKGRILLCNSSFARITGYQNPQEIISSGKKIILPSGKQSRDIIEVLNKGESIPLNERVIKKRNGQEITIQENLKGIYDSDGKLMTIQGNIIDISAEKKTELALMHSEEQYRFLFYDNPLPMWVFDFDSLRFLAVNNATIAHYGYSKKEFLKMRLTEIRPREEVEKYLEYRKKIKGKKQEDIPQFAGIWKHRKKNGEVIDVEVSRRPVEFEGKNSILVLAKDVTKVINAELALNKSNREISLLYSASRELSRSLDTERIYQSIYNIVSEIIPCDTMQISSYDSEGKTIKCIAAWHLGDRIDTTNFPLLPLQSKGKGIQSPVIRNGKSRILNNYRELLANSKNRYSISKDGIPVKLPRRKPLTDQSALIVPMKFKGKVIGIIQVRCHRLNAYKQEDLRILEALSVQLGASTSNAKLYNRAQAEINERVKTENLLKKKNKEDILLYNILKKLTKTIEPETIYKTIYFTLKKLMSCNAVSIMKTDDDNKHIRFESVWQDGRRHDVSKIPGIKIKKGDSGILMSLLRKGEPVIMNDYLKEVMKNKGRIKIDSDGKITKGVSEKALRGKYTTSSAMIAPVKFENRIIGIITIYSYELNAYSEENLRVLETFSAQLSSVLINASLYRKAQDEISEKEKARKELKKKTDWLSLMYKASRELTSTLDYDEIYEKIYKILSTEMPDCDFGIASFNSRTGDIKPRAIWQDGKRLDTNSLPVIKYDNSGEGILSSVLKSGESRIINDYSELIKKRGVKYYVKDDGTVTKKKEKSFKLAKSALMVPIISERKPAGVIQVLNYGDTRFTEEDVNLLEAFSSHISTALLNARLYKQSQNIIREKETAQQALAAKTGELGILYEAQKKMSSTLDLNKVYDNIYDTVSANMPCDSMVISSYDSKEKMITLQCIWAEDIKQDVRDFQKLPLAPKKRGIQSRVIRSQKPLLIKNYKEYYKTAVSKFTINIQKNGKSTDKMYSSAILVPMIFENDVIGTIQVLSYNKNAYSESDLKLLEALTSPITASAINARLYLQAQNEITEKEKAQLELALRNSEILHLYKAGREISSTLEQEEIYDNLYKNVSKIVSCDSMIVSAYDPVDNTVTCKAAWVDSSKNDASKFPKLTINPDAKGTQGEVIRTGEPLIVNNYYEQIINKQNKYYFDSGGEVIDYNKETEKIDPEAPVVNSAMFVPMKIGENVIGVINVLSYRKDAYGIHDLRMLESLSAQVTASTVNAELYERAQNEIEVRTRKEKELEEIRTSLIEAQRLAHIGNWSLDINDNRFSNSEEILNILGVQHNKEHLDFDEALNCIYSEDKETTMNVIKEAIRTKSPYMNEDRIVRPNGEIRYVKVMGEPVLDENGEVISMHGTMQDITEVKKINEELMKSLGEKEIMLKEIHHRVKNNLQVVSSLLRLQSDKITDKEAIEYFRLSEQRVKSMALIHQQLYRANDLSMINFKNYLNELCSYLFFVNDVSRSRISLEADLDELYYGIDIALPCGLIVNEVITNSLKHAFPGEKSGIIKIALKKNENGVNNIIIKDNGIGSAVTDFENTGSLGMELISTLTEQIEGKIEMNVNGGTETIISFSDSFSKTKKNN